MLMTIEQIKREELKAKLDQGEPVKLMMTMNEWAYNHAHIPGSRPLPSIRAALNTLNQDDDIIVYCTGMPCPASLRAYHLLKLAGYRHVRHYAGGLADWEAAGYPVEGNMVKLC